MMMDNYGFNGFLSNNVRIVKGTALYTKIHTTNSTTHKCNQHKLLTCQSNFHMHLLHPLVSGVNNGTVWSSIVYLGFYSLDLVVILQMLLMELQKQVCVVSHTSSRRNINFCIYWEEFHSQHSKCSVITITEDSNSKRM